MNKLYKFILDIIFPNRCPFCDKFIRWDKLACDDCIDHLAYADESFCSRCGKVQCICSRDLYYEKCYVACYYEGLARDGIINLKVKNAINAAEFFADILSTKINADKIKYDMIIPVPMSKKKQAVRGYNQAEEIARFISKRTNIPVNNIILGKCDSNIEQHTLNAAEREENVKTEFKIKTNIDLHEKNIIICDDVITTGSTLNECAKLIKKLGANKVILAVGASTTLKFDKVLETNS